MTQIRYFNSPTAFHLEMKGHAGYAQQGKDIVCAGLSVLASELILACRKFAFQGKIKHYSSKAQSGEVLLHFEYTQDEAVRQVVSIILECFQSLAEQYRNNISFKAIKAEETAKNEQEKLCLPL